MNIYTKGLKFRMEDNRPKVALIYDFDKTLSPNDMQAYTFIPKLGIEPNEFWGYCNEFCEKHKSDRILSYMYEMINEYKKKGIELTRQTIVDSGKDVELYKGVDTWFDRINKFGDDVGVEVEHYLVSSGIKEMVEGMPIAKYFKEIYAGYFVYDENNHPIWPALAINYTNKTQFIYRINKGLLNVVDDSINDKMDQELRPVPFTNMIYVGDSGTDVPCMRLIMKSGGYSIGIYQGDNKNESYLNKLLLDNRINFACKSDYSENSDIEKVVKEIILAVKHKDNLYRINKQQKQNL